VLGACWDASDPTDRMGWWLFMARLVKQVLTGSTTDVAEAGTVAVGVRLPPVCRGGDRRRSLRSRHVPRRSHNVCVPSGEDGSVAYLAGYSGQHRELNGP
jgi:hypothetical protein